PGVMLPVRQPADSHARERVPESVGAGAPKLLLRYYVVGLPPFTAVGRIEVDAAALVTFEYRQLPAPQLIGALRPARCALGGPPVGAVLRDLDTRLSLGVQVQVVLVL